MEVPPQSSVPKYVRSVSERYIELYEKVTRHRFEKAPDSEDQLVQIENNVLNYIFLICLWPFVITTKFQVSKIKGI